VAHPTERSEEFVEHLVAVGVPLNVCIRHRVLVFGNFCDGQLGSVLPYAALARQPFADRRTAYQVGGGSPRALARALRQGR